jgi:hypothetical protein
VLSPVPGCIDGRHAACYMIFFLGAIWFSIGCKLSGSSLMDDIQFISKFGGD